MSPCSCWHAALPLPLQKAAGKWGRTLRLWQVLLHTGKCLWQADPAGSDLWKAEVMWLSQAHWCWDDTGFGLTPSLIVLIASWEYTMMSLQCQGTSRNDLSQLQTATSISICCSVSACHQKTPLRSTYLRRWGRHLSPCHLSFLPTCLSLRCHRLKLFLSPWVSLWQRGHMLKVPHATFWQPRRENGWDQSDLGKTE